MFIKKKNGIRHPHNVREQAVKLRKGGLTHREIAKFLKIGLGSAFLWTKGINLTSGQKRMMMERFKEKVYTEELRKKLSKYARKNLCAFWKKPYSKEILLQKIKDFYKKHGRIPLKREFNMYQEYKNNFGSWNKAIKLAGFEPNKVIFTKKFIAKDGHICDSFSERIIDDFLSRKNISHTRNAPYAGTKLTADFAIGSFRIEFFGLAEVSKPYRDLIERKK